MWIRIGKNDRQVVPANNGRRPPSWSINQRSGQARRPTNNSLAKRFGILCRRTNWQQWRLFQCRSTQARPRANAREPHDLRLFKNKSAKRRSGSPWRSSLARNTAPSQPIQKKPPSLRSRSTRKLHPHSSQPPGSVQNVSASQPTRWSVEREMIREAPPFPAPDCPLGNPD